MELSDRIKFIRGTMTQIEFAEKISASLGGVQSWESRGQIPNGNMLMNIHRYLNVDINWLLTGHGEPYCDETTTTTMKTYELGNIVEMNHQDVIRRFIDKPYAVELNADLVELERLSPAAYRKVGSYIKGVIDGIKIVKQGEGHPEASAGDPPVDEDIGDAHKKSVK